MEGKKSNMRQRIALVLILISTFASICLVANFLLDTYPQYARQIYAGGILLILFSYSISWMLDNIFSVEKKPNPSNSDIQIATDTPNDNIPVPPFGRDEY